MHANGRPLSTPRAGSGLHLVRAVRRQGHTPLRGLPGAKSHGGSVRGARWPSESLRSENRFACQKLRAKGGGHLTWPSESQPESWRAVVVRGDSKCRLAEQRTDSRRRIVAARFGGVHAASNLRVWSRGTRLSFLVACDLPREWQPLMSRLPRLGRLNCWRMHSHSCAVVSWPSPFEVDSLKWGAVGVELVVGAVTAPAGSFAQRVGHLRSMSAVTP